MLKLAVPIVLIKVAGGYRVPGRVIRKEKGKSN